MRFIYHYSSTLAWNKERIEFCLDAAEFLGGWKRLWTVPLAAAIPKTFVQTEI